MHGIPCTSCCFFPPLRNPRLSPGTQDEDSSIFVGAEAGWGGRPKERSTEKRDFRGYPREVRHRP